MVNVSHLFHRNFITFHCNLQPVDALVPSWHELKHSVTVEIGLLYSQPFMTQPFLLPPYYKISDLIAFASVAHSSLLCSCSIDEHP